MITEQLCNIIDLSSQLIISLNQVELDNSEFDPQIASLQLARDQAIKQLFQHHSQQQLQPYSALLQQVVDLDSQLQQLANDKKDMLAKSIIKQKRNTKATNAYLGK